MNPRLIAVLALAALLLAACATKKESEQPTPDSPPELTATFSDSPAPKTLSLAGLGSFFSNWFPRKTPPPPTATPVQWAGEIRMVNIAENFVLLESNSSVSAIPGEKYLSIRDSQETGSVRMTSLRNPPFLIADIVSGDPSPGDKIHLPRPTAPISTTTPTPKPKQGFLPKFLREILSSSKPKQ
jgi:hypothetical protein